MSMNIAYVANIRLPTEKAHGLQIMSTCGALSKASVQVELVVPRRRNRLSTDAFLYYGVSNRFKIRRLFTLDLIGWLPSKFAFAIQTISFNISLFLYAVSRRDFIYYGRDEFVLAPLSFWVKNVYWETHTGSLNLWARILIKRAKGIICITKGLLDLYKKLSASTQKFLVLPDGVDVSRFEAIEVNKNVRTSLAIPDGNIVVTYSGSIGLYSWKGADVFLEASKVSPDPNTTFLVVGGSDSEIALLRPKYGNNVIFVGRVDHDKIPLYLKASDILVIPNKAGDVISEKYTSPMKLFEYMAARKPIVASDLPSIREVLSESEAIFAKPGDAHDLLAKILLMLEDPQAAELKAQKAFEKVQGYTWDVRASNILNFIKR